MRDPKFLDNKNNKVVDELREVIQKQSKLSIISAYFTIYAYSVLKQELSKVDKLRFIYTEPTFVNKEEDLIRAYYIKRSNEKMVAGNEFEIKLRNEMKQAAIAKECAQWLEKKAEIKSFLYPNSAQVRFVCVENINEKISIHGSVDFTSDGLGITPSSRVDSNVCFYEEIYTLEFLRKFDELWNDDEIVKDVKQDVLEQMHILYKENTPEFIYFVTLYNVFHNYLGELVEENIVKTRTGIKETTIWNKLFQFQIDGVMGAIDKIEKHNGCIIADSVGLGKTYTALAVIKYYELRNDRVLVIVPKKLRDNWTIYTMNDKRNIFYNDRFNYDVLNHTDLSRTRGKSGDIDLATLNWSNYDLVVIDESHNFRNNPAVKDKKTRYRRLMDDIIKDGVRTKVLMLSATPVNNKMNDIKNQIAFITEGRNDAFANVGLSNLENILKKAQTVFNMWSVLPDLERTTERFVSMMDIDYFKLLDTITIARSKKHIEKYYNLDDIGRFPQRMAPENIFAHIDEQDSFPPIGELNRKIKRLILGVYSPMSYLLPEKRFSYEEKYDIPIRDSKTVFKQTDREKSLVAIMRIGLLKRMESSIHSFAITVNNFLLKINKTLDIIEEKKGEFDPEMDISNIDIDDEEYDDLMIGSSIKILIQDMDLIKWKQDLLHDKEILESILAEAKEVTPERDAKLLQLKRIIKNKIQSPINLGNKKVIVFTAFADTAKYLYDNLSVGLAQDSIYSAMVTGGKNNESNLPIPKKLRKSIKLSDTNMVLTLFSPISKECAKLFPEVDQFIDVLIATDCVSEGQNLQDCDYLVNYDIHWNPVRIIQRFGRIDRIGSKNQFIKLVNFWATKDLDEYINLQQRVKGRMVLLDVSATGEENLIEPSPSQEMKDLEYRKNQLKKLQTNIVDLEDMSEGISITDLTFSDFKFELMEYMKNNKGLLDRSPDGMYAIIRINNELRDTVEPGVIFTLRRVKEKELKKEQNPLSPYYLVYITDSGEVKLSFLHAKKILDYYKKLCSGENEVLQDLVDVFNKDTNDGYEMVAYSDLLGLAIRNLVGEKQEHDMISLFTGGGTSFHENLFHGVGDFELVTFLIIKS
ncbi:MAG: helicase-related protein [Candidatus Cloacimonadia bacterium]